MKAAHVVRAASLLVRRYLGACALALVPGLSFAQVTLSQFPPNPGLLPGGGWQFTPGSTFADPPPPRAWVNGTYGGVPGVKATDALTLKGPAGNLSVTVARSASLSAVGGAVARCLGNPVCTAVSAAGAAIIAEALAPSRVYPEPSNPSGLRHDPGTPPVPVAAVCENSNDIPGLIGVTVCAASASELGSAVVGLIEPWGYPPMAANSCTVFNSNTLKCTNPNGNIINVGFYDGTAQECPASVDPLNPAYSIPAGEPVGPDGKCKTARYNHVPITASDASLKFEAHPPADPAAAADAALKGGENITPAAWEGTSGPASQIGTPKTTTTTNPNSTTTTVTTTNTYNYTYGSSNITYNTTTTTVTNNAGDITTTTTTTGPTNPDTDPENPCVKNPDSLGCAKFGTPEATDKPTSNQPISYTPETFAGGSCPAAASFTAFGTTRNLEFTPLCDAASSWVRGVVLVCAAALAAFVFVGGLKA